MAAGHLIADGDLSLLCDIHTNHFVDTGAHLIAVFTGEPFHVYDDTALSVRNFQRSITYFSCLLTEDGTKQTLFRGKIGLSLRSDFADEDIACTYFRTDAADSALIQILQSIITDTGDITGDLFRSEFGSS